MLSDRMISILNKCVGSKTKKLSLGGPPCEKKFFGRYGKKKSQIFHNKSVVFQKKIEGAKHEKSKFFIT